MGLDFVEKYGGKRTVGNGDAANPFENLPTDQLKEFRSEYVEMVKTGKRSFDGRTLSGDEISTINKQITLMNKALAKRF